jgi:chemotaxis family two-component system response regulator Rcp1
MNATRRFHILLVDDEPGDTHLLRLALTRSGLPLELHGVHDGYDALNFLKREGAAFRTAPRPDLILLDLKMPGRGGLTTLQAIKQIEAVRPIPVVVVTTSTLESDIATAYHLGAAGYLAKTADLTAFIETIGGMCAYWFRLVRLPEPPVAT